jgi:hypothetical protein
VDVIAYDQKLAHVYLPGADSGTIAIVGISSQGAATVLKTAETVEGAHCATVDDRDQVYVCGPGTRENPRVQGVAASWTMKSAARLK